MKLLTKSKQFPKYNTKRPTKKNKCILAHKTLPKTLLKTVPIWETITVAAKVVYKPIILIMSTCILFFENLHVALLCK